jgi:hypothetical protein
LGDFADVAADLRPTLTGMTYASPLGADDPGIGQLDRADVVIIEDACISLLERRQRLLLLRQRALKASNPRLPDLGARIIDEDDPPAA